MSRRALWGLSALVGGIGVTSYVRSMNSQAGVGHATGGHPAQVFILLPLSCVLDLARCALRALF
jgi:hypothetical protein